MWLLVFRMEQRANAGPWIPPSWRSQKFSIEFMGKFGSKFDYLGLSWMDRETPTGNPHEWWILFYIRN
jgi:hypothetical protein